MSRSPLINVADTDPTTLSTLLAVIDELVRETHRERATKPVTLDSDLERDLGLDSLGRTELLLRLERALGVELGEQALVAATPRELLRWVAAGHSPATPETVPRQAAPAAVEATPEHAETLLDTLDWHVEAHPNRVYIHLYGKDEQAEPEAITYAALRQGARAVAAGLRARDLQPGQTVAIMLPTERAYFLSFFGILLAGGIPVPIYPPVRPAQVEEHLRRHGRILQNAQAAILITLPQALVVARLLKAQVDDLKHVVTVEELTRVGEETALVPHRARTHDIAFLQYTSGSTGDPKGVMLTHANLLANLRAMGQRIKVSSTDVFVSWLPLYHDMGLIGACLGSLYYAYPLVVMSPLAFLSRPARWLRAIHRHRGTLSAAPNFAYELCARSIPDSELEGLDLGSWRMAVNGAEPINPDTLRRFIERFGPYGFRADAMAPVYGLAESSVGLALHPPARGVIIDRVQREPFRRTGRAIPAATDDATALCFPACGLPLTDHQIRIVDANGQELPERCEGRLEFQGPSCTSGYYRNPEATKRLFDGAWLDSGDRAYMAGGDVYLTGRVKDVIIRGGRNLFPYELESAVGEIEGIRKGCVAVFASSDGGSGTERLVVVAETRQTDPAARENLLQRVREVSVDLLAAPPDDIVLAPPHTVLKTSSGKIRRAAIRELYERDTLGRGGGALWWQLTRVAARGALAQARRWLRRGAEWLYGGYVWAVFLVAALLTAVGVLVLPRTAWRWSVVRGLARGVVRVVGLTPTVSGREQLATGVLVANHASYVDSYLLAAAISGDFSFVVKRELADRFPLGLLLKRLDSVFVERFDPQRSAEEGKKVAAAVRAGRSLLFFPEGTFTRAPGLLPFRMGAFVAAAQADVAVTPIAIQGTRSVLRAGSWLPRRGAVRIVIGESIPPTGSDWQAAVRLRDSARAAILLRNGEPDLQA